MLLSLVTTKPQDADKGTTSSYWCHEDEQYRKCRIVPLSINARQHVYIDEPLPTTSASQWLATEPYSKLMLQKRGPFRIMELSGKHPNNPKRRDTIFSVNQRRYIGSIGEKPKAPSRIHAKWDFWQTRRQLRRMGKQILQQMNSPKCCEIILSIVMGTKSVEAKTLSTSYIDTATHPWKLW